MAYQHRSRIEAVLKNLDLSAPSKFPGMSYEAGIDEALNWVLLELSDEEFSYAPEDE